jgi:BolA family transcriptional regulator, general stress-responsive regulator
MSVQQHIYRKIHDCLTPLHLEVVNESHLHSVPAGSESHFKVVVVSERFADQRLIQRHRTIHELLAEEFTNGLHALALHTLTPEEWFERGGQAPESPLCLGGAKDKTPAPG